MGDSARRGEELRHFLEAHPDIVAIDAFVIDVNGHAIGKRLPIAEAKKLVEAGVQFSAVTPLVDSRGLGHDPGGIGRSDGDPDALFVPVSGGLLPMPWASRPTAQWLCEPEEGAEPAARLDPRRILRDVVALCRRDGILPVMACELEFYLLDASPDADGKPKAAPLTRTGRPPATAENLSLAQVEEHDPVLAAIERAASAQGLPITSISAEYGLQQFELNLAHGDDPVRIADQAVLLKRLVKGVARAAGLEASFMAKPFLDQPGSGLHVHVSLVDEEGSNRFGGVGGDDLLAHAIGGMRSLFAESLAIFAPNINAFRRHSGPFVALAPAWGHNNRSVAFRVPLSPPAGRRIEHRLAGADASPHLVLAAILAAIHHGITHGIDPGPPTIGASTALRPVDAPEDFLAALRTLEAAKTLSDYIPASYLALYAALKRGEYAEIAKDFLPREHAYYL